jgi:hypothetical protein
VLILEVPTEDKVKVGENELCVFFKTEETKDLDNYAVQKGLKTIKSLVVQHKEYETHLTYILIEDGNVIYESKSLESVAFRLDVLSFVKEKDSE